MADVINTTTYETDSGPEVPFTDPVTEAAYLASKELNATLHNLTSEEDYASLIAVIPQSVLDTDINGIHFEQLLRYQEFYDVAYSWISNNIPTGISMDLITKMKDLTSEGLLATAIMSSELQALDDTQLYLRKIYESVSTAVLFNEFSINWRKEESPIAIHISLNMDITMGELTTWLEQLLVTHSADAGYKLNNKQVAYCSSVLLALQHIRGMGYSEFAVSDFTLLADKMDLIYEGAKLYGPAILKAIASAISSNKNDDEAALLAFFSAFIKIMPGFKDTYALLRDHVVTIGDMMETMLLGLSEGKLKRLENLYLGEGGFYDRVTPIVILGEIISAVLTSNNVSDVYLDYLLEVWPLKSSDNIAYFPTLSGFYYYEKGAIGGNFHFVENRWDGGVNIFLKVVDSLGKTKIPFAKLVSTLISLGFDVVSFKDSIKFAESVRLASSTSSYSKLFDVALKYVETKTAPLVNTVLDEVKELPEKIINHTPKVFSKTASSSEGATDPSPGFANDELNNVQDNVSGLKGIQNQPERLRKITYD